MTNEKRKKEKKKEKEKENPILVEARGLLHRRVDPSTRSDPRERARP